MPRQDQTGPRGIGSLTGRGIGPCGMGCSVGRGYGKGYGKWIYQPANKNEEKEILKNDLEILENEVKTVKEKIAQL